MKPFTAVIAIAFYWQVCNAQSGSFDYLGQTPPGNTPEVFAPGIISNTGIRDKDMTISPDGKELFFARGTQFPYLKIYHMIKSGDIWSSPDTAIFSKDCRATQPSFSPDGQYIYFSSSRGNADVEYYSLWRTKKNGNGWDEPENIVDTGGKNLMELDPIATKDGVYFLSWDFVNQIGDIGFSKNVAGVQTAPIIVGYPISTQYDEEAPYVDPDETYMIFLSSRPGGYGDDDSYISYKKDDGTWTNPKNLGPRFNTPNFDNFIDVSPDGKYLFLNINQDIYWVQAGNFIDSLRHTNFIPYVNRKIPNQTAIKDSLFNYKIPDSTFIDDDGNSTLRYSVILSNGTPLPRWLSFDSVTCVFSGIPDTAAQYDMKVTATDTAGASVSSAAFRITVTNPSTGIKKEDGQVPKGFTLDQNYPNPFNPSTTIRYSLAKSSFVRLAIFNLLGQRIRTLQNAFQTAGEYSLVWDARDEQNQPVSSGVYVYRLEADNAAKQKQMVLIK